MFDNDTTRRLAVKNLALRGIEADFGPEHADTFRDDVQYLEAENLRTCLATRRDSGRLFQNR